MKRTPFALLLAAALLIGTLQAKAEDEVPTNVLDAIADYEDNLEDAIDDDDDDDAAPVRTYADGWRRETRAFRHRFNDDGPRRPRANRFDRGPGRGPGIGFHHGAMGMGMGMPFRMFGPREWEALKLTADQKKQVVDLLTNSYRARLEAGMEMMETRDSLRKLHGNETLDAEAIIAANSAMGAARGRMHVLNRQLRDDLNKILTADQQKALEELRKPRARRPGDQRPPRPDDRRPSRGGPDAPQR